MIEVESFVDLHTHTRYPDLNNFPEKEIQLAAKKWWVFRNISNA